MGFFRVGMTRDLLKPDGSPAFRDLELTSLGESDRVACDYLAEDEPEVRPDQIEGCDALVVLGSSITARTLEGADRLAVIARLGVGYDSVDVAACTRASVALTITPDAVRRPVACSALALVLALGHRLLIKDRLTRAGRWAERADNMGTGLTGRALGVVGLGNIGQEVFHLAAPLGMRHMASDPSHAAGEDAARLGVELVGLNELLRTADFLCICCALTPKTHHLINAAALALMKETAFLINVARGPIVDQAALTHALKSGALQGAALDVFEEEPIGTHDPLLQLDNVIVTPHAVCWTDEAFRLMGRSASKSVLDVAAGRVPEYVVNTEVLEDPRFRNRLVQFGTIGKKD
jgi:D-3-phosphoglycerate dehydrogenase